MIYNIPITAPDEMGIKRVAEIVEAALGEYREDCVSCIKHAYDDEEEKRWEDNLAELNTVWVDKSVQALDSSEDRDNVESKEELPKPAEEACVCYRYVNGITLNPREYILDDDGKVKTFDNVDEILSLVGVRTENELEDNGMFTQTLTDYMDECKNDGTDKT